MRKHPELQNALASLIPSVSTPFNKDGSIDFDGLRNFVDHCIANGAKTLMLTYGDSLYSILTDAELEDVTRAVVEQARGRVKVIAGERMWWTGKAVEWARLCKKIGADILMVFPPDWAESGTLETQVAHYAAVAKEIPVMLVTASMAPRGMAYRLKLVQRLYEQVENVVAIKDDTGNEFGRRVAAMVQDRWTSIGGGSKEMHLYLAPYGCRGHLSTLIVYKPEVAHRYWAAVTEGNYDAAAEIVRKYDIPMFNALVSLPGSFDAGMHAWSELTGIYKRWRRSPYYNLTDAEVEALGTELDKIGLLERSRGTTSKPKRSSKRAAKRR